METKYSYMKSYIIKKEEPGIWFNGKWVGTITTFRVQTWMKSEKEHLTYISKYFLIVDLYTKGKILSVSYTVSSLLVPCILPLSALLPHKVVCYLMQPYVVLINLITCDTPLCNALPTGGIQPVLWMSMWKAYITVLELVLTYRKPSLVFESSSIRNDLVGLAWVKSLCPAMSKMDGGLCISGYICRCIKPEYVVI